MAMPVWEDRAVFTDYPPGQLGRHAIYDISPEMMRHNHMKSHKKKKDKPRPKTNLNGLPEELDIFFTKIPTWHLKRTIGVHFLCEGQRYGHIPGNEHIVHKDEAAINAVEYSKYYADGREHCFDPWVFMPKTYVLNDKEQCLEIYGILQSEAKSDEIRWIHKKARNSHNASGVKVITKELKKDLLKQYGKSFKCGEKNKYII
jgi:hypothetical protein